MSVCCGEGLLMASWKSFILNAILVALMKKSAGVMSMLRGKSFSGGTRSMIPLTVSMSSAHEIFICEGVIFRQQVLPVLAEILIFIVAYAQRCSWIEFCPGINHHGQNFTQKYLFFSALEQL